jgi:hypothetical protein
VSSHQLARRAGSWSPARAPCEPASRRGTQRRRGRLPNSSLAQALEDVHCGERERRCRQPDGRR